MRELNLQTRAASPIPTNDRRTLRVIHWTVEFNPPELHKRKMVRIGGLFEIPSPHHERVLANHVIAQAEELRDKERNTGRCYVDLPPGHGHSGGGHCRIGRLFERVLNCLSDFVLVAMVVFNHNGVNGDVRGRLIPQLCDLHDLRTVFHVFVRAERETSAPGSDCRNYSPRR